MIEYDLENRVPSVRPKIAPMVAATLSTAANIAVQAALQRRADFRFSNIVNSLGRTFYQVPMTLKSQSGLTFALPVDPLVSVSSRYNIVKRSVQKQGAVRGTVKEFWSHDDYSVQIAGLLMADDPATLQEYQRRLLDICNRPESVIVECEMLNDVFDILEIAIESIDFPFTKGEYNQTFNIKALSDESHSLLLE